MISKEYFDWLLVFALLCNDSNFNLLGRGLRASASLPISSSMDLVELKKDGRSYEMTANQLSPTNVALVFGVRQQLAMYFGYWAAS